jgi:hypothetical protein
MSTAEEDYTNLLPPSKECAPSADTSAQPSYTVSLNKRRQHGGWTTDGKKPSKHITQLRQTNNVFLGHHRQQFQSRVTYQTTPTEWDETQCRCKEAPFAAWIGGKDTLRQRKGEKWR